MENLVLYKPSVEELWFKQRMLENPNTMAYNKNYGGTIAFPKEVWQEFYNKRYNSGNEYFYAYIKKVDENVFVGDVGLRYDKAYKAHVTHVLIDFFHRGKKYGQAALKLLLDVAFSELNLEKVIDIVSAERTKTIYIFEKLGFKIIKKFKDEYKKEVVLLQLNKEDYEQIKNQAD